MLNLTHISSILVHIGRMYPSLLKQLLIAISMPPHVVFVMRSRLKIVNEEPKNSELYMAGFNHVSVASLDVPCETVTSNSA